MGSSARQDRLRTLELAARAWAAARTSELTARAAACKQRLQGRTGAARLTSASAAEATGIVVSSLDAFLSSSSS